MSWATATGPEIIESIRQAKHLIETAPRPPFAERVCVALLTAGYRAEVRDGRLYVEQRVWDLLAAERHLVPIDAHPAVLGERVYLDASL